MKQILNNLFEYNTLSRTEAQELFRNIVLGKYNEVQIASLMTVFKMREITIEELDGFKDALIEFSTPLHFEDNNYIDIVGTGGDGKDTFNISTCAAVVVASAGYKVVKHGNYGATSVSGASNVMEHHGVRFTDDRTVLQRSLDECNLAYLHAPIFNKAMKNVATVRKDLGIHSFFNMLGPLINPSRPKYQILGTYNLAMQRLYNYILQRNNVEAVVVYSLDGYDEISLTSDFKIVANEKTEIYSPEDLGFRKIAQAEIYGGSTIAEAARIFDCVLSGTATSAQEDCVVANAAFAINLMDSSKNILQAIQCAKEIIKSGAAKRTFIKFLEINR